MKLVIVEEKKNL